MDLSPLTDKSKVRYMNVKTKFYGKRQVWLEDL